MRLTAQGMPGKSVYLQRTRLEFFTYTMTLNGKPFSIVLPSWECVRFVSVAHVFRCINRAHRFAMKWNFGKGDANQTENSIWLVYICCCCCSVDLSVTHSVPFYWFSSSDPLFFSLGQSTFQICQSKLAAKVHLFLCQQPEAGEATTAKNKIYIDRSHLPNNFLLFNLVIPPNGDRYKCNNGPYHCPVK